MATFISGKAAIININSVIYPGKTWSLDVDDSLVEVSSMNSSGWKEFISGLRGATWSIEMPFDLALAQLAPGTAVTNMKLSLNTSYSVTFNGIIRKIRPSTSIEGAGMLSVEGSVTGVLNTTFA